jgi:hypothetical protein
MLIDQLTPHLPKDNEEVNAHDKHLDAMLDVATVVDPVPERDDGRGQDTDHRHSSSGDSASSLTPPEERGQRRDRDLHDIIHNRDARDRIENWRQEWDCAKQERRDEGDYDFRGPFYDQPHRQRSPEGGRNGVKAFSLDLKRVRCPLNWKPSAIEKYDGSTNPVEWLKVYQLAIKVDGWGLTHNGKLPLSLPISISHDVAPRTPLGVSAFMVIPMPAIH